MESLPDVPKRPDWMNPMDEDILQIMEKSKSLRLRGWWFKPGTLATNMKRHRDYVSRRLGVLLEHGMVERDERNHYRITQKGSDWLQGDLPSEDL